MAGARAALDHFVLRDRNSPTVLACGSNVTVIVVGWSELVIVPNAIVRLRVEGVGFTLVEMAVPD
jgi:hypothetical protein